MVRRNTVAVVEGEKSRENRFHIHVRKHSLQLIFNIPFHAAEEQATIEENIAALYSDVRGIFCMFYQLLWFTGFSVSLHAHRSASGWLNLNGSEKYLMLCCENILFSPIRLRLALMCVPTRNVGIFRARLLSSAKKKHKQQQAKKNSQHSEMFINNYFKIRLSH